MNEWLLGWGGSNIVIFIVLVPNLTPSEAFSLTFNNSVNSLSKLTTNDIFEFLSLSWFQNCPWTLDLVKKWLRYWRLKRRLKFPNRPNLSIAVHQPGRPGARSISAGRPPGVAGVGAGGCVQWLCYLVQLILACHWCHWCLSVIIDHCTRPHQTNNNTRIISWTSPHHFSKVMFVIISTRWSWLIIVAEYSASG